MLSKLEKFSRNTGSALASASVSDPSASVSRLRKLRGARLPTTAADASAPLVDLAGPGAVGSKGVVAGAGGSIGNGDIAGVVLPALAGTDAVGVARGSSGGAASADTGFANPSRSARRKCNMMDERPTWNGSP
ncbi:conserved hypothetical protein [Xanthomonas citri pv. citri]|uniref:Uncharacterized protein n=1 Tax=Xanthomonas citri pv. citri TaxID=611301 RepID=A0A0U5FLG5_XANCI|nr:conserved hypothetical protein [Xanthomonas citri pv. citri]CEE39152.1 conserved hypothetical protein [Xanthomonas citri pv. citri]CEE39191.1 conserved hypothetical protein [Xanthomonas citri pv. citri]CEE40422.1 conserved hypothetical protein [Xanthomonas citri pv. citri]CEE47582.1 conserved hypothetical protein [Xanthomonas citri pv. citri]